MFSPLVNVTISSIYAGPLPKRMARCTPDMLAALNSVRRALSGTGADLVLSDLFRSHDMQLQAHLDFVSGKKTAFSPAPGGSLHEAGRALDLDLSKIRILGLAGFWGIAKDAHLSPIVAKPDAGLSEAWHFDCRGSHQKVYDHYRAGRGDNFASPYTAMAASAILSVGQAVDALGPDVLPGYVQSALIRLGADIGDLDGVIGHRTRTALEAMGLDPSASNEQIADGLDRKLQQVFPDEFFISGPVIAADDVPEHLVPTFKPQASQPSSV